MKKFTSVIIGTGRIGFSLGFDRKREQPASHTMALKANSRIKLIGGADSDSRRLKDWKSFAGGKSLFTFEKSEDLYNALTENNISPDIITVAVNEESHMSECLKAIEAKPRLVILEKPVALNVEEALKIEERAKTLGVPVMVNHERRFSADYVCAKEYLSKIGKIQSVRGELYSGLRIYGEEFEKDGTYSLLHDGTHLIDIIQFLMDVQLEKPVITGVFKDDKQIVRNFTASYETKDLPEITVCMSGRSKFFSFGIDILGTEGRICIGNGYAKFYQRKESKLYTGFYSLAKDKTVKLPKKTGYFSNMIQNAVDFLDGKSELKSPLSDAINDLRALEEIKELIK